MADKNTKKAETEKPHDRTHGRAYAAGEVKKGGAGGKFTWGVAGVSDVQGVPMDPNDPGYDSEEEGNSTTLVGTTADVQQDYKNTCSSIINEYFVSEDVGEVARSLQELNEGAWVYEFVKIAIVKAIEKHDRERELTSRLLSSLYGEVLSEDQIEKGFRRIIERCPDLVLDTPSAADVVGDFIARAIVDEILPPAFLQRVSSQTAAGKEALAKAKRLLEGKNIGERIYNLWGQNSSAVHSAKKLKKSMRTLLEEYLEDGGDVNEADKCLRELKVPTAHFQFVKIGITLALERKELDKRKISTLLHAFSKSELISEAHMISGFKCCVDRIGDLVKDISANARTQLLDFVSLAISEGYLPKTFQQKAEEETLRILEREKADTPPKPASPAEVKAVPSPTTPAAAKT